MFIPDEYQTTINPRIVTAAPRKSEALAAALAQALAEEKRLDGAYGGEPQEDGTVIAFRARFNQGGRWYDYAAIRANGLWSTTGPRSPKSYSWADLVPWLDSLHSVKKFTVLRTGRKTNTKEN